MSWRKSNIAEKQQTQGNGEQIEKFGGEMHWFSCMTVSNGVVCPLVCCPKRMQLCYSY